MSRSDSGTTPTIPLLKYDTSGGPELPETETTIREPFVYRVNRVGRNEKCRCGSGVKFKKCCGGKVVRL